MKYALTGKGFLLVRSPSSYILIGRVCGPMSLCIEAPDGELCQGLSNDDIIVVSAPEGGPVEPAIMLLELVRLYRCPLVVLPKDHPGSARLRYVVSAGPEINLSCTVRRGTHPEQDVLCASDEFSGTRIHAVADGIEIIGPGINYPASIVSYEFPLFYKPA